MRAIVVALVLALVGGAAGARAQDGGVRVAEAGTEPPGTGTGTGAGTDEQPEIDSAPLPEGHQPEITLTIDPREGLATGDLVHVVITVRLPEGDDVNVPRQELAPFELHAQRHRDRPVDAGRREWTFEIDLLALEPGEHELPALRLRVITADGTVGTVTTEPQRITIGSLIANEPDAQPRPATRPVPVMQDDYTLAWVLGVLGAMLLTALATWLAARWWSRRPKVAPPPPPPRPAWETALAKLDALRKKSGGMLENGEHVALVDGVSDALREYLGARYDFNGLESTTDEVVARIRGVRLGGATVQEITALLGDCDLVKFAKAVPSQQQCDEMIAGAVRVVRATMPAAAPAIAPPAPGRPSAAGRAPRPMEPARAADASSPVPATREQSAPVTRGAPIALPLVVGEVGAVDAVVSAAVMGTTGARAADPTWDGTIVVQLAPDLPDEYAARMALRATHEKLAKALHDRRPGGVRVVVEHHHDAARKSVYGPGIGEEQRAAAAPGAADVVPAIAPASQPTRTGNAFEPERALEPERAGEPEKAGEPGKVPEPERGGGG